MNCVSSVYISSVCMAGYIKAESNFVFMLFFFKLNLQTGMCCVFYTYIWDRKEQRLLIL